MLSMLVGVLRRGIFPYPSLEDLKEHHRRVSEANEFSDQVSHKISPSSTLDIKEMWRLYRLASSDWQKRFRTPKPQSPGALNANARASRSSLHLNRSSIDSNESGSESVNAAPDDATILDDPEETKETLELKRYALHAFTEVADFYERARKYVNRHCTRLPLLLTHCVQYCYLAGPRCVEAILNGRSQEASY